VQYPGTSKTIVSGSSTETYPLTSNIGTLSIEEGATVTVEGSVTVGQLLDESPDSTCKLTVLAGNSLTATSMGLYYILVLQNTLDIN
jgi:hypothetical protein